MGQKVNANIFRIGYKNNEWDSKYLENNFEELSLYVYQDFKIKDYINRFFKQHKLLINSLDLLVIFLVLLYYSSSKEFSFCL